MQDQFCQHTTKLKKNLLRKLEKSGEVDDGQMEVLTEGEGSCGELQVDPIPGNPKWHKGDIKYMGSSLGPDGV